MNFYLPSVLKGTAALGTSVMIEGTGFTDEKSEITVTIGGVVCAVKESSTTRITCDVGNGPVGSHPVLVTVEGKGHSSGHAEFTYTTDITAVYPTAGSLGGLSIFSANVCHYMVCVCFSTVHAA